ncbi:hypothetical protein [Mycobacteroides abscessus]|uniref:hypothetical protein n=1 Tax=Mycobacteroides abscessus TaxID=36809 RepID=UPI0009269064|nr:hypothetical protein [Mycobacteroides abscessus]SHW53877.1 Uncharacterised protein [Mycobacteroides abscessus subsp. abscessus]SHX37752.1 Uncharacterised protein [Mycobacteroides abscessus subsp. abscessus]SIA57932.1 Uncharacterised protein [Mycobacteroides abscessus subsp. abscessus]SIA65200.1 Uncharacterised protein [Mycobacteroides abscessus subsp. abscessus]SIB58101.1 Uncharacterised protein [Mycobacteroides abscessus subsp. abscessus]
MSSNKEKFQKDPYQELASAIFDGLDSLFQPVLNAIRNAGDPSQGLAAIDRYVPAQRDFETKFRELEAKLTEIAERNGYHHQYPDTPPG